MNVVTAPGLLPEGPLTIACDLSGPSDILKAIQYYRPGTRSVDAGFGLKKDEKVVAVDGQSAQRLDEYSNDPTRQFVMPIPTDHPSSWWGIVPTLILKGYAKWCQWADDHCREAIEAGKHPHSGVGWDIYHQAVAANKPSIKMVLESLADQESQLHLAAVLHCDFEFLITQLLARSPSCMQYMEGLRVEPQMKIMNLGVHTGWDLPYWLSMMPEKHSVHSIDPMPADYLSDYVKWFLMPGGSVWHQVAMEQYDGIAKLPVTPDGQAYGGNNGEKKFDWKMETFPCITMKNFCERQGDFDIVKMDTEGAELPILQGGYEPITKMRPQMAISIYHELQDFWEIPMWCIRMLKDYKFYVRCYSFTGVETLLYCIPNEVETPEGLQATPLSPRSNVVPIK